MMNKKQILIFLIVGCCLVFITALACAETDVINLAINDRAFSFSGSTGQESNPEGRMAHNIYSDPNLSGTSRKFSGFSIDFMAAYAPVNTYWALCNWSMDVSSLKKKYKVTDSGYAYAGLQVTTKGNKGIMSFWEIHYKDKNGTDQKIEAKRVYPTGQESHFGGEGEGTNYIDLFDWKPGRWYRMMLLCHDDENGYTIVEQWFQDLATEQWTLFSSFNTMLQHSYMTGAMSQFMENYSGTSSTEFRSFQYKNAWVLEYKTGKWKPLTSFTLSVDTQWDNKKGYYAFGQNGDYLWGMTCGYGTDIVKTNPREPIRKNFKIPKGQVPLQ